MIEKTLEFEDLYLNIETIFNKENTTLSFRVYSRDDVDDCMADGEMNWQGIVNNLDINMYMGDFNYMLNLTKAINRLYKYASEIGISHVEFNQKLEEL